MPEGIQIARLPLPFRMGWVNCYLLLLADGFVLIDTGGANARRTLQRVAARPPHPLQRRPRWELGLSRADLTWDVE